MVAIVVIVLGVVVAYTLADRSAEAAQTACDQNASLINVAIEKWFFDKGRWPAADLGDIAQDPAYFPNGIPPCPVTGAPYGMDPRTHRVIKHYH
jgi:hypothetical protein